MRIFTMLETALAALLAVHSAAAARYDGTEPFICAPFNIVACEPGEECGRETAESVNLPQFLRFDVAQYKVSGTRPNGEVLTSAIESVRHIEDNLALQGVEGHVVWSVVIAKATGEMTLTAAGDGTGYVAFGACTPR